MELDGIAVVLVSVGLIIQIFLLETLGWIPASTILFMVVARAFGSRRLVMDAVLGVALTGLSFGLFNYGLDLNLPVGSVFERFLAEPEMRRITRSITAPLNSAPSISAGQPERYQIHGNFSLLSPTASPWR